jgi:hypothetical protein
MTNYEVTVYASASALETAFEAGVATTTTGTIIPYKEGSLAKFLWVTPAPNKVS